MRAFNFATVSQRVEGPSACVIEMNAVGEDGNFRRRISMVCTVKLLCSVLLSVSPIPMRSCVCLHDMITSVSVV